MWPRYSAAQPTERVWDKVSLPFPSPTRATPWVQEIATAVSVFPPSTIPRPYPTTTRVCIPNGYTNWTEYNRAMARKEKRNYILQGIGGMVVFFGLIFLDGFINLQMGL